MFAQAVSGIFVTGLLCGAALAQSTTNVVTYHNDNLRTGWNQTETQLTPQTVNASAFGLITTVQLDEQVDAQPLVFNNVVYVVTENDTVYAINPSNGQILTQLSLGTPVPMSSLPGKCSNNSNSVGITSTPVIDSNKAVMYVMAYTMESGAPVYRLHMLQLPNSPGNPTSAFKDTNVVVSASQAGFVFSPSAQRQRAGLLEANGNVYAAFASFCDVSNNLSRGWLLGWNAASLTPLQADMVLDKQTSSQTAVTGYFHNFYLSSIWMSGYGVAADPSGYLYFLTGNSDKNRANNLQESAVKVTPDLSTVVDYFTPNSFADLDNNDVDFGAGGIMILPDQPNFTYAVAQGKRSYLYSINRANMGKYATPDVPPGLNLSYCWCGPSYFTGSDSFGHVITSTGNAGASMLTSLKVSPNSVQNPLAQEASLALPASAQDAGFFTSISSNGTTANSQIIWAVLRPTAAAPTQLTLYAFNATPVPHKYTFTVLYSAPAGSWPNTGGNANVVPTVANGRVFVGSYKALSIFGPVQPSH